LSCSYLLIVRWLWCSLMQWSLMFFFIHVQFTFIYCVTFSFSLHYSFRPHCWLFGTFCIVVFVRYTTSQSHSVVVSNCCCCLAVRVVLLRTLHLVSRWCRLCVFLSLCGYWEMWLAICQAVSHLVAVMCIMQRINVENIAKIMAAKAWHQRKHHGVMAIIYHGKIMAWAGLSMSMAIM